MFGFDLQSLLDVRTALEEKRQLELAEAIRDLELQQEIFSGIKDRRRQLIREYYELEGKPVKSLGLVLYSENITLYRDMEITQQDKCRQAERKVDDSRLALIEASKQKKILEKYKEKKLVEYKQELSRKECKELDEAAILRYGGPPA